MYILDKLNRVGKLFFGIVSATPVLMLIGIVITYTTSILLPLSILDLYHNALLITGVILIIIATLLLFWANRVSLMFHKTLENPVCFDFMQGPYRFSRHPGALSMVIMLLGLSFIMNSITGLITSAVFFLLLTFIFIPVEEGALKATCTEAYQEYKQRVRMWL